MPRRTRRSLRTATAKAFLRCLRVNLFAFVLAVPEFSGHPVQQKQVLEFIAEHNRQQREFIVQVANHIDSIHAKEIEKDDELRELGLSVFESTLKETQADLVARMTGGIGYIKQKIDDGRRAEDELASLCPPRPQNNETESLFKELFAHFIKAIMPTSKVPSGVENDKSDSSSDVSVGSEDNSS